MDQAFGALWTLAGSAEMIGALLLGTLAGLAAGLTPGVSGRVGLLLATPVAIGLDPAAGAVFLVGFHSVVHTSGSVPAILVGAPTSAAEAATVIDGYAMARKGEGARAIGATLSASAAGGVIGALFLFLLIPVATQAITLVGTPEIAALSMLGLLSIAALSGGRMAAGLMVACAGVVIASVGVDPFTGVPRFTFGLTPLSDGVNAAALVTGIFVVPELGAREHDAAHPVGGGAGYGAVLSGCLETLRHKWLLLRASLLGAAVGMVPGLGASVAVWMAYGHARQTHGSATPYGEGAVAGVIAPEAANNSKEGGALAPTLFFGVPSSSGMGILLAAFVALGIEVGPRLLTREPGFVYLMGWTNILSNLIALPICLALAPAMARFAALRRDDVAPVALAAAMVATTLTAPGAATIVQIALFSALGLLLKSANLPRAPLLLGFVLGPALESSLTRSSMIHGWGAFARPGVIAVAAVAAALALASLRKRTTGAPERDADRPTSVLPWALTLLAALLLAGGAGAARLPPTAATLPILFGGAGVAAAGVTALRWRLDRSHAAERLPGYAWSVLGLFGSALVVAAIAGPAPAAALFTFAVFIMREPARWPKAVLIAGAAAAFALAGEELVQ